MNFCLQKTSILGLLALSASIMLSSLVQSQEIPTVNPVKQSLSNDSQASAVSVPTIAKQVSVRILAKERTGSGAIVKRLGKTYTVLTCHHVVDDGDNKDYKILTSDGKSYSGKWLTSIKFRDLDLAVVQFESDRSYQVATIAEDNSLSVGDPIYASGFPSWHWINSNSIENTRNWGMKGFKITQGTVGMLPNKSLKEGYQIGYTNDIEQGMSGGPVLNSLGQLVGINGGLKYPLQGIVAFRFADGTLPDEEIFEEMETLSWAIPVSKLNLRLDKY